MQTLVRPQPSLVNALGNQPLRLLALGDSLIYGYGDPEAGGWVEQLRRRWMVPGSAGHILYNLGIRGNGVAQVTQRLDAEFQHRGELRNHVPDGLILSVGVNDSARLARPNGRNVMEFEQFQVAIAHLLDRAQSLCPVWFIGMVPVNESRMPFLDCFHYTHGDQYRYKEATRLACQARQIPYLDLFEIWQARGQSWCQNHLTSDGLHPNPCGYRSILHEVLSWPPLARLD